MTKNKGREVQKKLVSLSPFANRIIKDYAVYYKTTDSAIVEDAILYYFFQELDVSVLKILKKELYSSDNLNSTFCELFKYFLRKKPEFVPCTAKMLEDIQNECKVLVGNELKKEIINIFDRTENEKTKEKWRSVKANAEEYSDAFSMSEFYEYFSENAEYMDRYSAEKAVRVLLEAYPCRNSIENRTRLIEGLISMTTGEEI